jgi:hypothetical protein
MLRVAPDELLLLGSDIGANEIGQELASRDASSLVLDVSDGYALWAIDGDDHRTAFARLSAVPLPVAPAIVQGLVAQVPAKVIVETTRIVIVVSSVVSAHVHDRIASACADLIDTRHSEAQPLHKAEQRVTA